MRAIVLLALSTAALCGMAPADAEARGRGIGRSLWSGWSRAAPLQSQTGSGRKSIVIVPVGGAARSATPVTAPPSLPPSAGDPPRAATESRAFTPVANAQGPWCVSSQIIGGFCIVN
jgi:hypothetical protein